MSSNELDNTQLPGDNEPIEEFISTDEVAQEVIPTNGDEQPEDDDEDMQEDIPMDEGQTIEIDMSNNSVSYFDKHTDSVFTLAHHPNLPLVVSGGADNIANLWTSHSHPPKLAGTITTHTESVICSSFTADGKFLITADMNGKILVHAGLKGGSQWKQVSELAEVEEVVWLTAHPKVPSIFAFGAIDGSVWCYQISEQDGSLDQLMSGFVHTQDCTMGEFINLDKGEEAIELVTCSLDSSVVGWNCYTGQQLFKLTQTEIKGLEAPWVSLAVAPSALTNGNFGIVAAGSNNGVLAIINANNNGAVLHLETVVELKDDQEELDASIESICWSPKYPLMAVGLVGGQILLYDTNSWRVRRRFVLEDSITKLIFDDDDIFASCINGKVYQYDAKTGNEKFVCVGHNMGVLDFIIVHPKDASQLRRVITAGDEGVSLVFEVPS
ncbi:similar to Saccharomyces cerevisiae YIR012W SQT1 Essential protein involved in a late step of 60S ribosomal subunit assembly or modification [Maudiozyma barnettii]|uniref:Similar to Saccharomyces cerevisiae YIR012W SQT1 Essential protein involved in a late step of 60S ribosomal subunit assembly or modification n=1 Tax=Maudiozyma barnettii TaxID=61262 RepID=A0A8H2ZJ91_9SACH|nr:Sqt1p [Kazachstania barnettii]CAB4255753.1 similar to Saccharomyces cerevisiae YIR012W SQT1 Essential protein involved in a late step of 60S ribosomal subunit assembly or modification [Kazachstania barnettii]CAD1784314.1 similar to Saccharomyces cerevisiae YIR012W SQT1 Essential protein involved in a late step of 60S ribosomal subunit assembly or modification [Kazachstania barnettii]